MNIKTFPLHLTGISSRCLQVQFSYMETEVDLSLFTCLYSLVIFFRLSISLKNRRINSPSPALTQWILTVIPFDCPTVSGAALVSPETML